MDNLKHFIHFLLITQAQFEVASTGVQTYVHFLGHVFIFDIADDKLWKIESCKDFEGYKKPENDE